MTEYDAATLLYGRQVLEAFDEKEITREEAREAIIFYSRSKTNKEN